MPDTPLNPDAFDAAWEALYEAFSGRIGDLNGNDCERMAETAIHAYLAAALPEREDERIEAWHAVASHPAFQECYNRERPLLESMLQRLTELHTSALPEVTSIEELEALPVDSVVLDRFDYPHHKYAQSTPDFKNLRTGHHIGRSEFYLPARVLYRPSERP